MNHFMLPEDTTQGKSTWLDAEAGLATRYGSFAMESLINGLLKLGARRERLEVKLFGGGHVLNAAIDVGDRNIEFARQWLRTEGSADRRRGRGQRRAAPGDLHPDHRQGAGQASARRSRASEIAQREQQYLQDRSREARRQRHRAVLRQMAVAIDSQTGRSAC